jgi:hypothetical protein
MPMGSRLKIPPNTRRLVWAPLTISLCDLAAQSGRPLVPKEFEIPAVLETDGFRLRMLTVDDAVKDYDAVMTSLDHLRGIFGPDSAWPPADLTLEQDRVDLAKHQKKFLERRSFAYDK